MAKRKKSESHTGFRNGNLFCFNCGQSYGMNLPQPINMAAAMMKEFDKDHKNCTKTWTQPVVDQSLSEEDKAAWWIDKRNGEQGTSSECMFYCLSAGVPSLAYQRRQITERAAHPFDPDDFRRCYLLLQTIPEWKQYLHIMKDVSPIWSNLIDNWDTLTAMLEKAMASPDGKAPEMYELMKKCGC